MRIDRKMIDHVAELASLSLTDEEASALAQDLDGIVRYVEELNLVDTEGVVPTTQVTTRVPLREDEIKPGLSHEEALASAPQSTQGGFVVPRFVDGS